jgi:hypothetical protein
VKVAIAVSWPLSPGWRNESVPVTAIDRTGTLVDGALGLLSQPMPPTRSASHST